MLQQEQPVNRSLFLFFFYFFILTNIERARQAKSSDNKKKKRQKEKKMHFNTTTFNFQKKSTFNVNYKTKRCNKNYYKFYSFLHRPILVSFRQKKKNTPLTESASA